MKKILNKKLQIGINENNKIESIYNINQNTWTVF